MNIFTHFEARFHEAAEALKAEGVLPADSNTASLTVEPPRDASHGDIASNAAMVLGKQAKMAPRDLAAHFARKLEADPDIAKLDIAGPGFINITLKPEFWPRLLKSILEGGDDYGRSARGQGAKVNVEYVSANPTGPMHVGHTRGAVFGDALSNLLAFTGHAVTREYYVNDAGAQVDVLARSAFMRYREALGEDIGAIPEGLYPGDYLQAVGEALAAEYGKRLHNMPEADWLPLVRAKSIEMMLDLIRTDLAALGIHHDVFFSERSLVEGKPNQVEETVEDLREQGLIYEGMLAPPKGKLPDDWEEREQTLFRATDFGDDVDRALVKSDGSYTYFASDMAYHRSKLRRGFAHMINVFGADHAGYVKRMNAAVAALSHGDADLDIKICQMVRLFRAGEPVKMSKRSGSFVTLREVVDEVGPGPVRFMMLHRKNDAMLDFDFAKVLEQSRDNPVFYVQYAHARAQSVMRNVQELAPKLETSGKDLAGARLELLQDEAELAVVKRLSHYPRIIESAAEAHEPHRIAFYLYELASEFHGLWNRGKELPHLRFIIDADREITRARAGLVVAVAQVIRSGLGILGVQPISEMR
ncbi:MULTISPECIES: arginine--tRNA ligase [Rhodomicrobium]|uniref:arginine--tRNA ligase n=1 Tax=Rhodomicrobium TaxID=1068 RepID=UPI000B4A84F5|nr:MULTISPECIES: arginine--tRNA ligase [Rhodomicrobium]